MYTLKVGDVINVQDHSELENDVDYKITDIYVKYGIHGGSEVWVEISSEREYIGTFYIPDLIWFIKNEGDSDATL